MRSTFFAVTAPGLEPLAARELAALGVEPEVQPGGVEWEGGAASLYGASLALRTASRIVRRVAEFRARSFIELERHLRRIEWRELLPHDGAIRFRVTSRKSKLYHEGAIEERFAREIGAALGREIEATGGGGRRSGRAEEEEDDDEASPEVGGEAAAQLLIVRFSRDRCVVSQDAAGELLHRRGYRQAVARAPLRETLAAATLLASGWSPRDPLLDPFCGSGTIPIEAALIARDVAPGIANPDLAPRRYAFERWPDFEPGTLDRAVDAARARVRDSAPAPIEGADRDAGAIEAARSNAARAGVLDDVTFVERPLSAAPDRFHGGLGWIVTNPPYGVRVGESRPLRDLYASLGNLLRDRLGGWRLAMLAADDALLRQIGIELETVLTTRNGGIPVAVVRGTAE